MFALSFQLMEEEDGEKELTDLQKEIEAQLERDNKRRRKAAAATTASSGLEIGEIVTLYLVSHIKRSTI